MATGTLTDWHSRKSEAENCISGLPMRAFSALMFTPKWRRARADVPGSAPAVARRTHPDSSDKAIVDPTSHDALDSASGEVMLFAPPDVPIENGVADGGAAGTSKPG